MLPCSLYTNAYAPSPNVSWVRVIAWRARHRVPHRRRTSRARENCLRTGARTDCRGPVPIGIRAWPRSSAHPRSGSETPRRANFPNVVTFAFIGVIWENLKSLIEVVVHTGVLVLANLVCPPGATQLVCAVNKLRLRTFQP